MCPIWHVVPAMERSVHKGRGGSCFLMLPGYVGLVGAFLWGPLGTALRQSLLPNGGYPCRRLVGQHKAGSPGESVPLGVGVLVI